MQFPYERALSVVEWMAVPWTTAADSLAALGAMVVRHSTPVIAAERLVHNQVCFACGPFSDWTLIFFEHASIDDERGCKASRAFGDALLFGCDDKRQRYGWSVYHDGSLVREVGVLDGQVFAKGLPASPADLRDPTADAFSPRRVEAVAASLSVAPTRVMSRTTSGVIGLLGPVDAATARTLQGELGL